MFKKIVVPIDVDYPGTSKAVFDNAADIAKLSGAQIVKNANCSVLRLRNVLK